MKPLFAALLLTACCAAQDGIDCTTLGARIHIGTSVCMTTVGKRIRYTEIFITDSGSYVHVITRAAYNKALDDDIAEMDRDLELLKAQAADDERRYAALEAVVKKEASSIEAIQKREAGKDTSNQDKHDCPTCDKVPDQIK